MSLFSQKPNDDMIKCHDGIITVQIVGDERLYLCGYARIKVIQGTAFINGAKLAAKDGIFSFYSPKSSSLLYIASACAPETLIVELHQLPEGPGCLHEGEPSIASLYSTLGGIKYPGFENLQIIPKTETDCLPLDFPSNWKLVADGLENASAAVQIVFVIGPRKVGKSTMARYLANSLWSKTKKVAFLDFDLGQTEFTPPGSISLKLISKSPLLGPPLSHQSVTEGLVYLGSLSPADNPRSYLDGCQQLVDLYLKEFFPQQIPLVVNTMGWVTGLGLSVLQHLLHLLPTTHIVAFSNGESGAYDYVQQSLFEPSPFSPDKATFKEEDVPNVAYLDPAEASGGPSSRLLRYNPAEMRSFTFWTYFMGKYSQEYDEMKYDIKRTSFKAALPFAVPIDQINLIFPYDTVLPKGLDLLALNLAVVGLAHWDENRHVTIAIGLIRSIDITKRLFYVLTPLSLDMISKVSAFVVGALRIPPSILCLADNADGPYLSYANFVSNTGSTSRKTRNNIGRKWTNKS